MIRLIPLWFAALGIVAAVLSIDNPAAQSAASVAPPDFTGVYYPYNPGRGGGARPGGAAPAAGQRGAPPAAPQRGATPPRPTQSAPLSDGSQGRSADAPKLTPEYLAKWELMRKSRISGSYEYDNNARCLPPGMPAMMGMAYGMEIQQTKDRITFFSELNDAMRRVYLDGRKPTARHLDDPTYAGYSTGRWEGDTLVVETVALHPDSFIEDPVHQPGNSRRSHHRPGPAGADGTLADRPHVSKSIAAERRAA
jgi:hypothetical protein